MSQMSVLQVLQVAKKGPPQTRLQAVKALYQIGTAEAGQGIRVMARDEDGNVRKLAVQAYQQLEQRLGGQGSIPAGPPAGYERIAGAGPAPGPAAAARPSPAPPGPPKDAGLAGLARPSSPASPASGGGGLAGLVSGGSQVAGAPPTPAQAPMPPQAPAQAGGLAGLVGAASVSAATRGMAGAPAPGPTPAPAPAPSPAPGGSDPALETYLTALGNYRELERRLEAAYGSLERLRDSALERGVPESQVPLPEGPGAGAEADSGDEEAASPTHLDEGHRQLLMQFSQLAARADTPTPPVSEEELPGLRAKACKLLAPVFPHLEAGLSSSRDELKDESALALGRLGSPNAYDAIEAEIRQENFSASFFDALGHLKDPRGLPLLVDIYTQDRFAPMKQYVVHAMSRIPGSEADQQLARLLDDPDPSIRVALVNHIGSVGRRTFLPSLLNRLGSGDPHLDVAIAKALVAMDPDNPKVHDKLQETLAQTDPEGRLGKTIITALGATGNVQVLQAIQPYTKSKNDRLKKVAIEAVCALPVGVEVVRKLLNASLRETNAMGKAIAPKVRAEAAVLAHRSGDERGLEIAKEMAMSQTGEIRALGCWAVGETGHEGAIGALRQSLQEKDSNVRLQAVRALSKIGSSHCLAGLTEALKDTSEEIRAAAAEGLGQFGAQGFAKLAEYVPGEYSALALGPALLALGKTDPNPPSAWRLLEPYLGNDSSKLRIQATRACHYELHSESVEPLLGLLTDPEQKVRTQAARALWKWGEVRLVPRLLDLFGKEDDEERLGAARMVAALGSLHQELPEEVSAGRLIGGLRAWNP